MVHVGPIDAHHRGTKFRRFDVRLQVDRQALHVPGEGASTPEGFAEAVDLGVAADLFVPFRRASSWCRRQPIVSMFSIVSFRPMPREHDDMRLHWAA